MRGSVKKDSERGTWCFVVDVGVDATTGKRRRIRRRGFATMKQAHAALAAVLQEAQTGEYREPSDEPLGDYMTRWAAGLEGKRKPATVEQYRNLVRLYVKPYAGGLPLRAVDAEALEMLYATLRTKAGRNGEGVSAGTVSLVHKVLRRGLGDAVESGKLRANPAAKARPDVATKVERPVWNADQVRTFLAHVNSDRQRALWVLALMTGMRRGELAGLRWADIDLESRSLAVRRNRVSVGYAVRDGVPKTGRARTVELDDGTVAEMRAHRKRQLEERLAWGEAWTDTGLVFTRENGDALHPQTISQGFEQRATAAKLPRIPFHCVRHTHASLALKAGVPAKVVQERLGHANIAITLDLYAHVLPGMQRDAADQVAALVMRT